MPQELPKLSRGLSPLALSDIGRNGNRCSPQLAGHSVKFVVREGPCDPVNLCGQVHGLLPRHQLSIGLHRHLAPSQLQALRPPARNSDFTDHWPLPTDHYLIIPRSELSMNCTSSSTSSPRFASDLSFSRACEVLSLAASSNRKAWCSLRMRSRVKPCRSSPMALRP